MTKIQQDCKRIKRLRVLVKLVFFGKLRNDPVNLKSEGPTSEPHTSETANFIQKIKFMLFVNSNSNPPWGSSFFSFLWNFRAKFSIY